ncbi:MAG: hypothetical protein NAOJABEB_00226 [Steroidobacteraceae bacterium]|nr:hypothetical protein [Steroidobacteraceae bacterium]
MQPRHVLTRAAGTVVALVIAMAGPSGCSREPGVEKPVQMDQVRADLLTIAQARVFFGHHSVGNNILKGVRTLADKVGVPLRIEEVAADGATPEGPGLFHGKVGENLDPDLKITDFAARLGPPGEHRYDIAMFKFCYVDLDEGSKERSPGKLFERYANSMSVVERTHPGVTILHATMPLMAEPPGRKTRLKRLLGLSIDTDAANVDRSEFNRLTRERYANGTLIDVARFEATRPDGSIAEFKDSGREIEMLALEYTSDGGHLNAIGQERVAAEFLHRIAEALRAQSTG